jgi:hypothetical protein
VLDLLCGYLYNLKGTGAEGRPPCINLVSLVVLEEHQCSHHKSSRLSAVCCIRRKSLMLVDYLRGCHWVMKEACFVMTSHTGIFVPAV